MKAIWDRNWEDERTYFNTENALVQKQDARLVVRIFGIPVLRRAVRMNADVAEKKNGLGFKNAK